MVDYIKDLFTQHLFNQQLISTLKAELLSIAIMIDTDNLYTKEEIKNSILGLVSKELDGYNLNLELLKNKKE
ncbi:hypothetical protein [Exiguobacterium sp. E4787]|uniref:hypothetical protein n=1 Tax=Exiguobacterium sp. E4787 TaxID=2751225 RepID=UPI001BE83B70|nr:hypothetical protein [Exiguobacterium sp. E4787]